MSEEEKALEEKDASTATTVPRPMELKVLPKPTCVGWWWHRTMREPWLPVEVDEVEPQWGGGLRCFATRSRDNGNPEHAWHGQWVGPLSVPSVEPAGPKSSSGSSFPKSKSPVEALVGNALSLQMALGALEPFKRLAEKFDVEPYSLSYPDALRISGTGDNASKADVVRQHCFITLGDCRKAKLVFNLLERNAALSAPSVIETDTDKDLGIPGGVSGHRSVQGQMKV